MIAYYNEFDPKAAAWLRSLIAAGLIPPGVVDARDIRGVTGAEAIEATQRHYFAGVSGWALALGLAGWPADRPVWTGSCPCQPYSPAGKGLGDKDPRNLWPELRRLITVWRPPTVFGEQTSGKAGRHWLARVRRDLEQLGYAVGCADIPAAGVGAPHIRNRLYWCASRLLADPEGSRGRSYSRSVRGGEAEGLQGPEGKNERRTGVSEGRACDSGTVDGAASRLADSGSRGRGSRRGHGEAGQRPAQLEPEHDRRSGGVGDAEHAGLEGRDTARAVGAGGPGATVVPSSLDGDRGMDNAQRDGRGQGRHGDHGGDERIEPGSAIAARGVDDADGLQRAGQRREREGRREAEDGVDESGSACGVADSPSGNASNGGPPPDGEHGREPDHGASGFWSRYDLVHCRDGKARRIPRAAQPGVQLLPSGLSHQLGDGWPDGFGFPLAQGKVEGRVMLLRGFGNAVCVPLAVEFIKAFMEAEREREMGQAVS